MIGLDERRGRDTVSAVADSCVGTTNISGLRGG